MIETIAATYILLHAPGGHMIAVNPDLIVTMRQGTGDNTLVEEHVRCVISTNDGKLVNVVETCDEIRKRIKER